MLARVAAFVMIMSPRVRADIRPKVAASPATSIAPRTVAAAASSVTARMPFEATARRQRA